ncbi:MAG: hypothetical protein CMJ48_08750 [Planctomycetaceae bacterium]|nr:hypothetical protein [Planctomycetaceae bacterium]
MRGKICPILCKTCDGTECHSSSLVLDEWFWNDPLPTAGEDGLGVFVFLNEAVSHETETSLRFAVFDLSIGQ